MQVSVFAQQSPTVSLSVLFRTTHLATVDNLRCHLSSLGLAASTEHVLMISLKDNEVEGNQASCHNDCSKFVASVYVIIVSQIHLRHFCLLDHCRNTGLQKAGP